MLNAGRNAVGGYPGWRKMDVLRAIRPSAEQFGYQWSRRAPRTTVKTSTGQGVLTVAKFCQSCRLDSLKVGFEIVHLEVRDACHCSHSTILKTTRKVLVLGATSSRSQDDTGHLSRFEIGVCGLACSALALVFDWRTWQGSKRRVRP
jgi:hypothetical protein